MRASYAALFAVIGTTFGSVDGTHFTLPDLQDKTVLGKSETKALGSAGGADSVNLQHSHTVNSHYHNIEGYPGCGQYGGGTYAPASSAVAGHGQSGNTSPGTNNQLSTAQSILPPYVACNYIIKT